MFVKGWLGLGTYTVVCGPQVTVSLRCILLLGNVRDRTLLCGLSYGFMQRGEKNTELHVIEMRLSVMFLNVYSNGVKFIV